MGLDSVDNDSPFAMYINSTKRLNVSSFRWAKISFFNNILQSGDRVVGVSQNILVHLLN